MARQERPVDPTAGPLQAFAYDLRKLRAEAGSPTYRVLARTAGYSATTLSEAASGTRLPTLDVLLAYVGACGGDLDEWRRRWYETSAQLDPPAAKEATAVKAATAAKEPPAETVTADSPAAERPAAPVTTAAPAGEPPAGEPAADVGARSAAPNRRWLSLAVGAGVGATLLVVTVLLTGLMRMDDKDADTETAAGSPSCPAVPPKPLFTGTTYNAGAHVRSGASRDDSVLTTIPPECTVGFVGYCIGEKVYDNTAGTPDVRWFMVAGGGVVSSAVIHGNPPRGTPPSECPNARPAPSELVFSARRAGADALTLHATARELDVVGFTVSTGTDPANPEVRTWRQVGLIDVRDRAAGGTAQWTLDRTRPVRVPIVLVAAACLGGDTPTGLIVARQVDPANLARAVPVTLDQAQATAAARSACRYPGRG